MIATFRAAAGRGLRLGWAAARENVLPGLFIQALIGLLVVGYYLGWPTTRVLDLLAAGKRSGGLFFSFLAMAFFGGFLSETCKIVFLQGGRWRPGNGGDLLFKFLLFGMFGVWNDLFYSLLGTLLGTTVTPGVVLAKMALDQFGYTLFLSIPVFAIAVHWRHSGWRGAALAEGFSLRFYAEHAAPLLPPCWCFWIPGTLLVYTLPLPLQFPLCLLATTIWSLIAVSAAARRREEAEVVPIE